MEFLFESPLPALLLGLVLGLVGLFVATQSNVKVGIILVLDAIFMAGVFLALERWIETPREKVEATFASLCQALEKNDVQGVLKHLDTQQKPIRDLAESSLAQVTVKEARITSGMKVTFAGNPGAQTAEAKFIGRLVLDGKTGLAADFKGQPYVKKFTVQLRNDNQTWLLTGFEQEPLIGAE